MAGVRLDDDGASEIEGSHAVEIAAGEAGARLDRALADRLGVSRARVRHLLEVGRVWIGGHPLSLSDKARAVAAGEDYRVVGALRAESERPTARPDLPLAVAAEGAGWICVDKPAGIGVHPLRPDQDDTVLNAVVARYPEILGVGEAGLRSGVVHRLDVGTSGALLFATDAPIWKRLRGAFSTHRVDKRYRALVAGRFERERRIVLRLEVTRHQPARVEVRDGGRPARQHVTPLRVFEEATLVEVRLHTGFLHQIRATLSHLGHPVLGDPEYGDGNERFAAWASRPLLHAERLAFEEIDVRVEPPADFLAAIDRLASGEA